MISGHDSRKTSHGGGNGDENTYQRVRRHLGIHNRESSQSSSTASSSRVTMLLPVSTSPTSSTRLRSNSNSPIAMRSSSSRKMLTREDSNLSEKDRPYRSYFTTGQAFALATLCAAFAVAMTISLTTLLVFHSAHGDDMYADQLVASTTRSVISRRHRRMRSHGADAMNPPASAERVNVVTVEEGRRQLRPPVLLSSSSSSGTGLREAEVTSVVKSDPTKDAQSQEYHIGNHQKFPLSTLPEPKIDINGPRPHIAWLMSFPNSGTSFTLHLTREASNCTTATNYALEGDIKDEPSVPAIPGKAGENGPFLELIRERHTDVPSTILTKTHCKGICARDDCGPWGGIETVRSFMMGCLSGVKAVEEEGKIVTRKVTYDESLVKKAIHIFRHPLDNVVARFHLDYHDQPLLGNTKFTRQFPRNAEGFRKWCAQDDKTKFFFESRYTDDKMRHLMMKIPCMNEFYRYVQWHNLAFDTSRYLNLPTMMLHYHEYTEHLEAARDRVLDWLELPHVGPGEPFHTGKVYRHYYTLEQRRAIRDFLKEFASAETWEQLKDYDFELEPEATVS